MRTSGIAPCLGPVTPRAAVPRASIEAPVIEIVPIAIYLELSSLIAGLAGIREQGRELHRE